MGQPIAMKLALSLFALLLCVGCGATKSTQTTPPPNGTLASGLWQFNQDQGTCGASQLKYGTSPRLQSLAKRHPNQRGWFHLLCRLRR